MKKGDSGKLLIGSAYNILRFGTGGDITHDGYTVKPTFRGHIDSRRVDSGLTTLTTDDIVSKWATSFAADVCTIKKDAIKLLRDDNGVLMFELSVSCTIPNDDEGDDRGLGTITDTFAIQYKYIHNAELCKVEYISLAGEVVRIEFAVLALQTTQPITQECGGDGERIR